MKNNIKLKRKELKISQEDLAAITHVSRQTVNAIENEKYDPELTLAFRLSKALNTTVDELFAYDAAADMQENEAYWCEKYKCVLLQSANFQQNPGLVEFEMEEKA